MIQQCNDLPIVQCPDIVVQTHCAKSYFQSHDNYAETKSQYLLFKSRNFSKSVILSYFHSALSGKYRMSKLVQYSFLSVFFLFYKNQEMTFFSKLTTRLPCYNLRPDWTHYVNIPMELLCDCLDCENNNFQMKICDNKKMEKGLSFLFLL